MYKIGHGYDVHRFDKSRKLILCGEEIEFEMGLLGHSDADVATHALMDSIIGALGLGDIGKHFPDNDPEYKGISSIFLLDQVYKLMDEEGYKLTNADITIVAQKPKLIKYIPKMRENLAKALKVEAENINVKATTEEGLSFTGEMKGIAAHSVCLICKK